MKKKRKNGKVKSKLNLTFFILYYFDPISFHKKKSLTEQNKTIKYSLRLKVKNFQNLVLIKCLQILILKEPNFHF